MFSTTQILKQDFSFQSINYLVYLSLQKFHIADSFDFTILDSGLGSEGIFKNLHLS